MRQNTSSAEQFPLLRAGVGSGKALGFGLVGLRGFNHSCKTVFLFLQKESQANVAKCCYLIALGRGCMGVRYMVLHSFLVV